MTTPIPATLPPDSSVGNIDQSRDSAVHAGATAPQATLQAGTPTPVEGPTLPGLLAGLTYQTPVIGTIRIGGTNDIDGVLSPFVDDKFSVHTRYRDSKGDWVIHSAQKTLEEDKENLRNERLCSIPVRIIYDNPNLNMGEQYAAFGANGRPACVGNGVKAKRAVNGKVECVECAGPSVCDYGSEKEHSCETYARALFHIEGQDASEGAFIFRTRSYNSVNDMRVRLQSLHAGFGGKLSGLPMKLEMRAKSTALSDKQAFHYVSLEPRFAGFKDAMAAINARHQEEQECGFNRKAFENSMVQLLSNGSFSENAEDAGEYQDLIVLRREPRRNNAVITVAGPGQAVGSSMQTLEGVAKLYGEPTFTTNVSPSIAQLNG